MSYVDEMDLDSTFEDDMHHQKLEVGFYQQQRRLLLPYWSSGDGRMVSSPRPLWLIALR